MREFINLVEAVSKPLPTRTFRELWHVGSMDPAQKRSGSYEGAGLSVSLHPEEWRRIARGHVSGDLWRCTKSGNRFLDAHKLTKAQRKMIEEWGVATGLVERASLWRFTWWDDEDESERFMEFPTREEAEAEADGWDIEDAVTEVPGGLIPTELFNQRTRTSFNTVDFGLLVTLYVEDTTDLDGVWWNDDLDVGRLSAPRGVIVPQKIKSWTIDLKNH